jgi:DNA polymerase-3 subunit epsilon
MDFCAIDFETANGLRNSACAVALVKVINNRVVEEYQSLINQEDTWFRQDFIALHGITAKMTASAPSFVVLWPNIAAFIGNLRLAAHNAAFDIGVLKKMLEDNGINRGPPEYFCSLEIARSTWPDLRAHSLDVVAEYLGIELDHHNALSDARACAAILLASDRLNSC